MPQGCKELRPEVAAILIGPTNYATTSLRAQRDNLYTDDACRQFAVRIKIEGLA